LYQSVSRVIVDWLSGEWMLKYGSARAVRQGRRWMIAVGLALLAMLFTTLVGPLPVAHAAVPDSIWTVSLPRDSKFMASPSGGVLAIPGSTNAATASSDLQLVTATGGLGWAHEHLAGRPVAPAHRPLAAPRRLVP
jgi:hypothetical protein